MKTSKRIISIVLALVMIFAALPVVNASATDASSTGATLIKTAAELNKVRNNLSGSYILVRNIDLSSFGSWTPIGTSENPFTGSFDGNGYTVSGLSITNNKAESIGFFGKLENATIQNLHISGSVTSNVADFTSDEWDNADGIFCNTGSIAGDMENSVIERCSFTGSVSCTVGEYCYSRASGIACGTGTIRNCYCNADVYAYSFHINVMAAGIDVWTDSSTVDKCYFTGSVKAATKYGYAYAGGINASGGGTVSNCVVNSDSVSASTDYSGSEAYSDTIGNFSTTSNNLTGSVTQADCEGIGWDFDNVWEDNNGINLRRTHRIIESDTAKDTISSLSVGDTVEFGSYPQTDVTSSMGSALTAAAPSKSSWNSYNYYISLKQYDYMKYYDLTYNGNCYRGVYFTSYRPYLTIYSSSTSHSYQDDNGYTTGNVYWFKYEPLTWKVLDPTTGYVICETIIDSQAFNNGYYENGTDEYDETAYYNDTTYSHYVNNWEYSTIRTWLNETFYTTAFTSSERKQIPCTKLTTPAYSTSYSAYDVGETGDYVFLPSYQDMLNTSYGFSSSSSTYDMNRRARASDYAKSQGIYVNTSYTDSDGEYTSYYRCRSAGRNSDYTTGVHYDGYVSSSWCTSHTYYGVRPALCFNPSSTKAYNGCEINGHSWNSGVVTTAATCTTTGVKTYTCTRTGCGSTKTESISALGHSWNSGVVTTAATCTTTGVKTYTCTRCSTTKTETIAATGHTAVTDKAVAATCTTAGKTEGSHCSVCNAVIKAQTTVAALGHSWNSGVVTTAATCTTTGVKTYTCTRCSTTKTETIAATGHTAVTDKAVAATCTTAGKTEGSHCSVCNAVIKAQTTVAALGHSWNSGVVTTAATCTTTGVKTYTCTRCSTTKTETIAATGHKLTKTAAVAATCTTAGNSEYYTCSACGKYFSDSAAKTEINKDSWVIAALGHSWNSGVVTTAATCTTTGVKTYTCTRCSTTKTETIAATGHKLTKTAAVAATCTTAGNSEYYTCSACGKYFSDSAAKTEINKDSWIIPATGHKLTKTAAVAATCTTAGNSEYYTCSACGKYFSDSAAKTEINKDSWVIAALGHSWNSGVVTTAATCTTTGVKTYTCTRCSTTKTETIAATGHKLTKTAAVAATCTTAGNSEYYTCSACSKYFSDADAETEIEKDSWIIPATGHKLTKTAAVAATCTTAGNSEYYTCSACGKYFSDSAAKAEINKDSWVIAALGHSWNSGVVTTAATCTTTGVKTYTCTRCSTTKTETIAATGHNYGVFEFDGKADKTHTKTCANDENHTVTEDCTFTVEHIKEPTYTEEGYDKYTCSVCGGTYTIAVYKLPDNLITLTEEPSTVYPWIMSSSVTDNLEYKYDPDTKWVYIYVTENLAENSDVYETGEFIVAFNIDTLEGYANTFGTGEEVDTDGSIEELSSYINPPVPDDVEPRTVYKSKEECPCICTEWYVADEYVDNFADEEENDEDYYGCLKYTIKVYESSKGNYFYVEEYYNVRDGEGDDIVEYSETNRYAGYIDNDRFDMLREEDDDVVFVAPTGHNYVAVVTASTCVDAGYTTHTCSKCGDTYIDSTTAATGHKLDKTAAVAATCTTAGNSEYYTCSVCGKYFSDAEGKTEIEKDSWIIPAKGHTSADAVKENEVAATCTKEGSYDEVVYCSVCKTEISRETKTVDKIAHTPADAVKENEVASTCTKEGSYDEVVYCSVCNAELSRETKTVSALGHDEVKHDAKAATCTENGWNAYVTCSRCDYTTYKEIPATGHAYTVVSDVPATCTTDGVKTYKCDNCDDTYSETVKATGHNYKLIDSVTATCVTDGKKSYKCDNCGDTYTVVITATGHKVVTDKAVAATCIKEGLTQGSHCAVCGEVFVAQKTIPTTDHKIVTDKAVEATCTTAGKTEGSHCSVCGTVFVAQETIPAGGHVSDNGTITKKPTCVTTGTKTYRCTTCGKVISTETIEMVDHKPGAGVVTKKATCSAEGVITYRCTVCGNIVKTEAIAKLPHTEVVIPAVPATCHSTGLTEGKKCSVCGEIIEAQQTVAKLSHVDDNGDGTCDECGTNIQAEKEANCTHICHSSCKFLQFIWKILRFFCKLFKINKYCDCGVAHY